MLLKKTVARKYLKMPRFLGKKIQKFRKTAVGPKMVPKYTKIAFNSAKYPNLSRFAEFLDFLTQKPRDFHAFFSRPIFSNALGPAHALPRLP